MRRSLPNREVLGSVRFQEVGQRIDVAADLIVRFLDEGLGRVVDTTESDDDSRAIQVVGYDLGGLRATESAQ